MRTRLRKGKIDDRFEKAYVISKVERARKDIAIDAPSLTVWNRWSFPNGSPARPIFNKEGILCTGIMRASTRHLSSLIKPFLRTSNPYKQCFFLYQRTNLSSISSSFPTLAFPWIFGEFTIYNGIIFRRRIRFFSLTAIVVPTSPTRWQGTALQLVDSVRPEFQFWVASRRTFSSFSSYP